MRYTFFIGLTLLAVAGCTSVTKEACLSTNWQEAGFQDGANGRAKADAHSWRSKCALKNFDVDYAAYDDGFAHGLTSFCKPQNIFAFGARGGVYKGNCEAGNERGLQQAYFAGRTLFDYEREVSGLRGEIRQAEYDRKDLENRILDAESELIAPVASSQERALIIATLRQYQSEHAEVEYRILALEDEIEALKFEIQDYRSSVIASGYRGVVSPYQVRY